MKQKSDCQYAIQEKWSKVIYRCNNQFSCRFEMIYGGTKYCIWSIDNGQKVNGLERKANET